MAEASQLSAATTSPAATGSPTDPKPPHFPARAKRVIFLFMHGGPSSVDTFDPKERLTRDNGKTSTLQTALGICRRRCGVH